MKRIFVTFCAAIVTFAAVSADLNFGIKLGASVSSVKNQDVEGPVDVSEFDSRRPFLDDYVVNFVGGVAAKIDLWKGFGIDPEVLFQQVSGKIDFRSVSSHKEFSKANYRSFNIAIPVLLRYRLDLPGRFAPFVGTGPVVSFRLQNSYSYAIDPALVQFDWRVAAGVMINKKTEIALSYNIGLGNYAKYAKDVMPDISNRVSYLGLTVGYLF